MANQFEELPRVAIEAAPTLDGTSFDPPAQRATTARLANPLGEATQSFSDRDVTKREALVTVADGSNAPPPTRIGRYVVLRKLGQGGMGVVYSAYDEDLDRKVAIKLVRNGAQSTSIGRTRVLQEAQAMARIAHPNVVHVYEVGQEGSGPSGQIFIAMEFIAGLSLGDWQEQHRKSTSFDELLRIYLQAAAGLAAAHDKGLIHRESNPS